MAEASQVPGWPLRDVLGDFLDRLERRFHTHRDVRPVPWGYTDILAMLGGEVPKWLAVLTAPPPFDDESVVLRLAHCVAVGRGSPVLVLSAGGETIQIAERFVAIDSDVPDWQVHCGRLTYGEWEKIGDAISRISDCPIWIEEVIWNEPWEVADLIRRFGAQNGAGFVVLDTFEVLAGVHPDSERLGRVADVADAVRDVARELKVPLVTLRPNDMWLSKEQQRELDSLNFEWEEIERKSDEPT